jgi:NAD+ synthase
VDIEPIGMLYKREVREIAKILKIPDRIIMRVPSAGLWPDQTDEGEIGLTYDELDEIIYRIDYNLTLDNLNNENVEKVKNMMKLAEHKQKVPPTYQID